MCVGCVLLDHSSYSLAIGHTHGFTKKGDATLFPLPCVPLSSAVLLSILLDFAWVQNFDSTAIRTFRRMQSSTKTPTHNEESNSINPIHSFFYKKLTARATHC